MKMAHMPAMTMRTTIPERMDAPDCSEEALLRTVDQFASINRLVSRYQAILARWVLADMLHDPERDWHLLDMGAGGCDIDAWLLAAARRRGMNLRITACDVDARIVRRALEKKGHLPGLTIQGLNVLTDAYDDPVDYVFANHFLHHLSDDQIGTLIRRWAPRARACSSATRNPLRMEMRPSSRAKLWR
jgi:hypothetical protein